MPANRLSMRNIREVLRLKSTTTLSNRQIAESVGMAPSTVGDYLGRALAAGLGWPLPEDLDDPTLERQLFVETDEHRSDRPVPDWRLIDEQLRRKGVTRRLLWQEYRQIHHDGYNYSQFCARYAAWLGSVDPVMRQSHRAGERLFVDYAGMTLPLTDPASGELRQAQIFVATLGASNYTYVEATPSQALAEWIASHQRAFAFFGGVPELVVPDNLRSAVSKPHRYDPQTTRAYAEMAKYYGVAILPARVRKPRDKAKVEAAVQVVERWILARLRDRRFHSIEEINQEIAPLLAEMNDHPLQKLPGSRASLFREIDRPALRRLPETPWVNVDWRRGRVGRDYHVAIIGHYYSVPHRLVGRQLDVRLGGGLVEIFEGQQRVAVHRRSDRPGERTTLVEHMPERHRAQADTTLERLKEEAARVGEATLQLVEAIVAARAHPEQGLRPCLGILRLGAAYGVDRLEAAATRALLIKALNYQSVASILKSARDRRPLSARESAEMVIDHANIRGGAYYRLQASSALETEETTLSVDVAGTAEAHAPLAPKTVAEPSVEMSSSTAIVPVAPGGNAPC